MNNILHKFFTPALVVGFGLAALLSVSIMQMFFILIVPAAGFLASRFEFRLHPEKGERPFLSSIRTGIAAGIYAAFFMTIIEVIVTMIFKTNNFVALMPEAMKIIKELGLPEADQSVSLLNSLIDDIQRDGFSGLYTFIYFISNSFSNAIFCLIGSVLFAFSYKRNSGNV
ncbi:MAG: hypothetical protein FMNOHCHN_03010 [Ignavibacteriaceae bacterium]|nr:hypothetical protein [Ignavibacteriaceae bacterium]